MSQQKPEVRHSPDRLATVSAEMGASAESATQDGLPVYRIERERLPELLRKLRDDPELRFAMLTDICSVDDLGQEPRFTVVYHLLSLEQRRRVRIKTQVTSEDAALPTVTPIYPTADWHEREVYDLMGIRFAGHPHLKRILMPEEYRGHPLRKDHPLEGTNPEDVYLKETGKQLLH
ncbi:MAG: NADH-quinone oxidoreductase subunit C [Planctomycetota bacterium]